MTRDEMIEALDEWLRITERQTDAYAKARCALDALRAESREASVASSEATLTDEVGVDEIVSALYRRFKYWSKRGFGPNDVTWCEVRADVLALIRLAPASAESREAGVNADSWGLDPNNPGDLRGLKLPPGWTALNIAYDPENPDDKEDVAFGPQRMIDRLKVWLDRHFSRPVAPPPRVPDAEAETLSNPLTHERAWAAEKARNAPVPPQPRTLFEDAALAALQGLCSDPGFRLDKAHESAIVVARAFVDAVKEAGK